MGNAPVLRKHTLAHIPELKISDEILQARFASNCSTSNCLGKCCRLGVDVDIGEKDRILEHAELIRNQMDDDQERVVENWFGEPFADTDFPSGLGVSTSMHNGACVFLNKEHRCVVQLAESHATPGIGYLKPFFCRAYPICIEDGFLTIDRQLCIAEFECCGPSENGEKSIVDICELELEYVLGEEGVRLFRTLANKEPPGPND